MPSLSNTEHLLIGEFKGRSRTEVEAAAACCRTARAGAPCMALDLAETYVTRGLFLS